MGQYLTRLGKKPHQAAEKGSSEGPQLSIESFSALARPQMWFFRPLPQIHPALGYRNQLTKTLDGHNSAKLDCREDILASRLPAWQAPSAVKSIFFIYSLPPGHPGCSQKSEKSEIPEPQYGAIPNQDGKKPPSGC